MYLEHHLAGIIPYKLIRIDGGLVESYNHALTKLIGKETSLKAFSIDKRGYSPEVEAELGQSYLQNSSAHRYMIIVTPSQCDADLLYDEFSFDAEMIDYVYRNYQSVISAVTRVDCLYGELNDGVPYINSIGDCVSVSRVEVDLDTPTPFLRKARKLQNMVVQLRNDPELLVSENSAHLTSMLELVEEVGDIRRYQFTELKSTMEVESFYTSLFGGVFVFRSLPDTQFYPVRDPYKILARGNKPTYRRKESGIKVVVIHCGENKPKPMRDVEFIHIEERTKILLFLLHNHFIRIDFNIVATRIKEIEDYMMLMEGYNLEDIDLPLRHRFLSEYGNKMPPIYRRLIEADRLNKSNESEKILPDLQIYAMKTLDDTYQCAELVELLVSYWWQYDIKKNYESNKRLFLEQFAEAADNIKDNIKGYCTRSTEEVL